MLKVISYIVIFISCTCIGYYYGETYKKRSTQLNNILKATLFLNNEVIYANTPMPEALKYISFKVDSPIKDILVKVSEKLLLGESNSIYESFKEAYEKMSFEFRLNKEDLRIIKDFLKSLGESGVYGQDKLFNLTIENLKINCSSAEEIARKNVKMYRSLGICIGAMIVIFLI